MPDDVHDCGDDDNVDGGGHVKGESDMVLACGMMLPTDTFCLMDVKDVGRHRPEILCVAKPGEGDCRGARFEEVRLTT